jgi:hypothetical protein
VTAPIPIFTADTAPRDALLLTLDWLADVVPDVTVVRSRGSLRRSSGTVQVQVRLQSSTHSRRGVGTWVNVYVSVADKGLARWRDANPDLTWRTGDYVYSSGTLSPPVQLYGDEPGYRDLAELPDLVEAECLPRLGWFDSPQRLAEEFDPAHLSTFTCMEWMVFRGDVASARRLLERYLEAHPSTRTRLEEGRAAGLPPKGSAIRDELRDRWGPTLETLGIVAPGEALPGVPSELVPDPVDDTTQVRAVLSELGRVTEF